MTRRPRSSASQANSRSSVDFPTPGGPFTKSTVNVDAGSSSARSNSSNSARRPTNRLDRACRNRAPTVPGCGLLFDTGLKTCRVLDRTVVTGRTHRPPKLARRDAWQPAQPRSPPAGETRRFERGAVVLVEDTEGAGHASNYLEDGYIVAVRLA